MRVRSRSLPNRCATVFLLLAATCTKGVDPARCTAGAADCMLGKRCVNDSHCGDEARVTCNRGVCMAKCPDGNCGPGQFCAALDRGQFCLVPCDEDTQKCPAGASGCEMYWPQRKLVCAVSSLGPACKAFVAEGVCSTTCGPQYFTTPCDDGGFCPGRSECSIAVGGKCDCWNNQPVDCSGVACPGGVCPNADYNCSALELGTTGCRDEPHDFGGKCECTDGRVITVTCGETSSCEHRCSVGCSLTQRDCPDRWASKCTYRAQQPPVLPRPRDRTVCVPLTDTKVLGAACTRTTLPDGGTEVGLDDCAAGLVCEPAGAPRGELRCRSVCTSTSECGSGQVCARSVVTLPPSGYCLPATCSLGGAGCGPGQSCGWVYNVERGRTAACKYDGDGGELSPCSSDSDCGANLGCGEGLCRPTCSLQRPCVTGACRGGVFPEPPDVLSFCY